MSLNFVLFYGSVRTERQGIKLVRFLDAQLRKRGHGSTVIDPLHYQLPLLDKMYKEYPRGAAPKPLEAIANHIRHADGFLIVSGEYNHGIPRGMVLAPVGDRLLFRRPVRRSARRDPASRHACRARNAEHLIDLPDAQSPGPVRGRRHAA
jgi:hypothetical protein